MEKQTRFDIGLIRRSSRHRRMRGEKEVCVNATSTLRDLKLQVRTVRGQGVGWVVCLRHSDTHRAWE